MPIEVIFLTVEYFILHIKTYSIQHRELSIFQYKMGLICWTLVRNMHSMNSVYWVSFGKCVCEHVCVWMGWGTLRPLKARCSPGLLTCDPPQELSVCPDASIIDARERDVPPWEQLCHLHTHRYTHFPLTHSSRHVHTHAGLLILLTEPMLWTHGLSGRV